MAWIDRQAVGVFLPAWDEVCLRRESLKGVQAFGEGRGMQAGVEVLWSGPVVFVGVTWDGGLL